MLPWDEFSLSEDRVSISFQSLFHLHHLHCIICATIALGQYLSFFKAAALWLLSSISPFKRLPCGCAGSIRRAHWNELVIFTPEEVPVSRKEAILHWFASWPKTMYCGFPWFLWVRFLQKWLLGHHGIWWHMDTNLWAEGIFSSPVPFDIASYYHYWKAALCAVYSFWYFFLCHWCSAHFKIAHYNFNYDGQWYARNKTLEGCYKKIINDRVGWYSQTWCRDNMIIFL